MEQRKKIPAELVAILDATDEHASYMTDADWFSTLEDAVVNWNRSEGTSFDPTETVQMYLDKYELKNNTEPLLLRPEEIH